MGGREAFASRTWPHALREKQVRDAKPRLIAFHDAAGAKPHGRSCSLRLPSVGIGLNAKYSMQNADLYFAFRMQAVGDYAAALFGPASA
ncbi:hypothetical protein AWB70_02838 [Caballeronia cordobensis]|uniref:Uncharacterized protein n=1 Tax=Caballeronia cordobensis TaxID=1353886 RepID=A0A158H3C7_CABCO|nr:hypothetical protein AWB70_02838 [Caballeronia cordobensis]